MEKDIISLKRSLEELSIDGAIPCREALKTATEYGVDTRTVAGILDEMGIKIVHCQLGCFP